MSQTATATPETAAGSSSTSDPIESLDFSELNVQEDTPIPSHMMLGGPEAEEPEPVVEAKADALPALPDGYTRDSMGRVRDAKTGHVVSKDKVAELLATASQQPAPDAKPLPFQYRANGETKPVDGFMQNADGSVTVAPEKAGELRHLLNTRDVLAEGSALIDRVKSENATLRTQVEQFKSGSSAEASRANALVDAYTAVLQEPNEAKALEEFFRLRQEYPVLLAKAEANYYKTQAGRPAPSQGSTQEAAGRESAPSSALPDRESAIEATTEHIERVKLDFKYRDVAPEDWKQFTDGMARKPFAYLRPATAAEVEAHGVTLGQIVFDRDALAADIEQFASTRRVARETAAQQVKLAASNARATAPSIDAPPTAGGGSTPAKVGKGIKSKQDWEDYMNSTDV